MGRDFSAALRDRITRQAVHLLPEPETAAKLRRVLDAPEHSAREVAHALRGDPMAVAALLRLASSTARARGAPFTGLARAVPHVGEEQLERLALALTIGASPAVSGPLLSVRQRVAQDALASAYICERLAIARDLEPEPHFLAGLLHDVGALVALGTLELLFAQARDQLPRPAGAWLALAQVFHVELGTLLAAQWDLPAHVRQVIEHHHDPDGSPEEGTALVQTADVLLALMHFGLAPSEARVPWLDHLAPAARESLLVALGEVPALVAASDGEAFASSPSRAVVPPRSTPSGVVGPCFAATLSGGRAGSAELCSPRTLLLRLRAPVPENHFAELELSLPEGPLTLWVRVSACTSYKVGDAFEVTVLPFAPTKAITQRLRELWLEERHEERAA